MKVLATPENLRRVGLFIMEHPSSRSESSYEDVDPLDKVSSPAGPVVRPLGPIRGDKGNDCGRGPRSVSFDRSWEGEENQDSFSQSSFFG